MGFRPSITRNVILFFIFKFTNSIICLDSRTFVHNSPAFLFVGTSNHSKTNPFNCNIHKQMNDHSDSAVFAEPSADSSDDSQFYTDDDDKPIYAGIEVHTQLASPFKAFCACRSIASPVTKLNLTENPDAYKTEPAENRRKVYEGFRDALSEIASTCVPQSRVAKTHFDSETPLQFEEYVKRYYESDAIEHHTDVDEKGLNDLIRDENKHTCPVCRGDVGGTPYLSPMSLLYAMGVCKVLDCKIANKVSFDRKCYEYFDLPKGYQITQTLNPLGRDGHVQLSSGKVVKIKQVHLEEDTARRVDSAACPTGLDFNRSGVALAEIVTVACPLTRSEVVELCKTIYDRVVATGLSNGNRFRGNFRFDINLSLPDGSKRIEAKNINSFATIRKVVNNYDPEADYRVPPEPDEETSVLDRIHAQEMANGVKPGAPESTLEKIKNVFLSILNTIPGRDKYIPCGTTMRWVKHQGLEATRHKRTSEFYGNYFETNIPVLALSDELIARLTRCLPAQATGFAAFAAKFPAVNAELLREIYKHASWVDYFERLCATLDPRVAASQFVNSLLPLAKASRAAPMSPERFSELMNLVVAHKINMESAQHALPELARYEGAFEDYFRAKDLILYDPERAAREAERYLRERPPDPARTRYASHYIKLTRFSDSAYLTWLTADMVRFADSKISYQFARDYVANLRNEVNQ